MLVLLWQYTTKSTFSLTTDFFKDLKRCLTILAQYNVVTFYGNSKPKYVVHLDIYNSFEKPFQLFKCFKLVKPEMIDWECLPVTFGC